MTPDQVLCCFFFTLQLQSYAPGDLLTISLQVFDQSNNKREALWSVNQHPFNEVAMIYYNSYTH